jgi:hypothetical protein
VSQRYFAALIGFGFVAVWILASFGSAILCLVGAAVAYVASMFLTGDLDAEEVRGRLEGARAGMQQPQGARRAGAPSYRAGAPPY